MLNPNRVMVIAAHPDDEVLGCGGVMALHIRAGHDVSVVIAAGRSAEESGTGRSQSSMTQQALAELGVKDIAQLGLPDQKLDTLPILQIVQLLEREVERVLPTVIYVHHHGDVNRDHRVIHEAAMVATRPTRDHINVVYAYETASSTEWGYPRSFNPDTFVDIGDVLEMKTRAMELYSDELRDYPHPRSIEGLRAKAVHTGVANCLGPMEAFVTIRRIYRDGQAPV